MSELRIDNNSAGAKNLEENRILKLKEFGKNYLSNEEFKKLEDGLNSFMGKKLDENFLKNWEEKVNSAFTKKAEEAEEYAKYHGTGDQGSRWEEGRDE